MSELSMGMLSASTVNLVCFEVEDALYAIEITSVREIVRMTEITPLPKAPPLIEGIVDLRGTVIPVLDLARVLGRGKSPGGRRARIVVLELDGLVVGLQVDAVTDVIVIDAARLEDVPGLAARAGYDAVRHVVRRPGEAPVMVLDVEALIESVYRSAIPDGSETTRSAASIGEVV